MSFTTDKHNIYKVCLLIAGILLICAYAGLGPDFKLYPRCAFRELTGLLCPGCGMQRGIAYILRGELIKGLSMNWFLFCFAVPVMLLYLYTWLRRDRNRRLYSALCSPAAIAIIAIATIAWWAARNALGI